MSPCATHPGSSLPQNFRLTLAWTSLSAEEYHATESLDGSLIWQYGLQWCPPVPNHFPNCGRFDPFFSRLSTRLSFQTWSSGVWIPEILRETSSGKLPWSQHVRSPLYSYPWRDSRAARPAPGRVSCHSKLLNKASLTGSPYVPVSKAHHLISNWKASDKCPISLLLQVAHVSLVLSSMARRPKRRPVTPHSTTEQVIYHLRRTKR